MSNTLQTVQAEMPRCFPLVRYVPEREPFNWREWSPSKVHSINDLPQYLLFGRIDLRHFELSQSGWMARWQGKETDTFIVVGFIAGERRWNIVQSWCGSRVETSLSSEVPLDELIMKVLYVPFPPIWDKSMKAQLESRYQVSSFIAEDSGYGSVGIPDGVFRAIAFPVAVYNLRPVRLWLKDFLETSNPEYPVYAEVRQVFQAVSYVEGRASAWTSSDLQLFDRSVRETGLLPEGLPEREVGQNGSAAWTIRRFVYYVFIHVPISGLTDFLMHMATTDGPIRAISDPPLPFEWQTLILPEMFEVTCESASLWDPTRAVRLFLQFRFNGQEVALVSELDVLEVSKNEPRALRDVESASKEILAAVERMVT